MLERVGGLLGHVGRLVRSCHEHWDGNGYPDGLAGEAIPLVARIVCACDAFSAMTTDRSYRAARTEAEAIDEMVRGAPGRSSTRIVVAALVRVNRLALSAEPVAALGTRRQRPFAERLRARDEVGRHQAGELGSGQRLDVTLAEPERLRVQRLLEERAREARVAERLVALGAREDRAQRVLGALAERVLATRRRSARRSRRDRPSSSRGSRSRARSANADRDSTRGTAASAAGSRRRSPRAGGGDPPCA